MDELKNISPKLSRLKKEVPFKVPDNYFDDFSARLQMKLEAEKKNVVTPKNRIVQFLKPALGLAASFALIFMLVYWPLKSFTPSQEATNDLQIEMPDSEYLNIVEGMDDNSFYALLEESAESVDLNDEELLSYVSANVSDYDIYLETDF